MCTATGKARSTGDFSMGTEIPIAAAAALL
jgi:hypothetical protein